MPVAVMARLFARFCGFTGPVARGEALGWSLDWAPRLGVSLSFHVDARSLAVLHPISFKLAMPGLCAADTLISIFGFRDLTTIVSGLRIGNLHLTEDTCHATLHALLVIGLGAWPCWRVSSCLARRRAVSRSPGSAHGGDVIRELALYPALRITVRAASSPGRRRCLSTSGYRTRWWRRGRFRHFFIRLPWARAASVWCRGCIRRFSPLRGRGRPSFPVVAALTARP
jgi:hypothetical protein